MADFKTLMDQKAALIGEGDEIFAKADKENRGLTKAELERDDAITASLTDIEAQISAASRHKERRRQLEASPDGNQATADQARFMAENGKKTFSSLGEQLIAIAAAADNSGNGFRDPRLVFTNPNGSPRAAPTGMSEGIASDGGFLVQTDFITQIYGSMWDGTGGDILSRIDKHTIGPNSNGIKANAVDETSRATGSRYGGFRTFWTPEAGQKLQSQGKFRRIEMELQKVTGLCFVTDEMLQDSTFLSGWMQAAFQEEMTFAVEDAIVNGTGAGQPLGFLGSGALITVPAVAGQTTQTINQANILAMWMRLPPRSRQNAVWLLNQDAEAQLYTLFTPILNGTTPVGGIVSMNVVFQPAGVNANGLATLMGRPVITIEQASTLGTAGDIMLVDLSAYMGIDKGVMQAASSIHVRFIYDETAFRFVYRFNGQPIYTQPLTPYRGTNTLSPFVVLASR